MAVDIDSLQIEIEATSSDAALKIDQLATALTNLKSAAKGGAGLTTTTKQLKALSDAAKLINGTNLNSQKIQQFASAMNSLSTIQKASGLNSAINALKKLPEISAGLDQADLGKLAKQMDQVASAMRPLAAEMQKVASGFSAFPIRIQKIIQSNAGLAASNNAASKSFGVLGTGISRAQARLGVYAVAFRQIARVMSSWVQSANKYIENVNLFQVSMGEFYDEAYAYAMLVSDRLGIDPSEWMRAQGVFMSMANGFGLAREQAYALSEGLTELAYDLSSLYNEDVEQSTLRLQSALSGEIEPIRRLGISISQATLQEYALAHGIDESVDSMTEQEKALLRSLVLMEGAGRIGAIGDFAKTLESPANAMRVLNQQITQLGRALGTVLLPIIVQIIPWVQAFVEILTDAIRAIASFIGFTMPEWDTTSWENSGGIAEESIGGVTDAVKELKNATIGIDELNVISPQEGGGGGGSGGVSDWAEGLDIPNIWDQLEIKNISSTADKIKKMVEDNLSEITAVVSGFSLAIGAILALSGANIPLGLALIAIGAVGLVSTVAMNWGTMDQSLRGVLISITGMLGGFMLALGAILSFSGANIPLGIALMAVGAVSLATSIALNWSATEGHISGALSTISGIVGGSLLAVGAVLAFSGGNIPLGIALMAAGAISVISAIALNWSSMDAETQASISRITAIVSAGALALGAILTLTGASPMLGIALLAVGAATLATTAAINWDSMTPELRGSLTTITAIVGGSLLALGAILTLSGANIPLGIALLAGGAVSLASAAAMNWESVKSTVTKTMQDIGISVGTSLLALGAILALSGVALPIGLGLMAAGGVSLATGVALNWGAITSQISNTLSDIGSEFQGFVSEWLSPSKWMQIGQDLIDGLFEGMSNIWDKVTGWGSNLIDSVCNLFGIHSPSTVFRDQVGVNIALGTAEGMEMNMEAINNVGNAILQSMLVSLGEESSYNLGYNFVAGLTLGMQESSVLALEQFILFTDSLINEWRTRMISDGLTSMLFYNEAMAIMTGLNTGIITYSPIVIASWKNLMNEFIYYFEEMSNRIRRAMNDMIAEFGRSMASIRVSESGAVTFSPMNEHANIPRFAMGGFPEHGQLFFANEAGPELVGTIGNRTAVANEGQIEAGIASGVETANAQQNALLREQNELLRAILAKESGVYLDGKQIKKSYDRASRSSGVSIMAGGVMG